MVAYLLSELLEVGTTHRQSAARTLDSPSWKASDGSTTFSLGIEAWILLQVQRLGAMDWGRYESRRLGSTLHRILLYIEQPDFILYKISCRVDAFCACALKRLAKLWRAGLTWPDLIGMHWCRKWTKRWKKFTTNVPCYIMDWEIVGWKISFCSEDCIQKKFMGLYYQWTVSLPKVADELLSRTS